jgi:hypothetical protein
MIRDPADRLAALTAAFSQAAQPSPAPQTAPQTKPNDSTPRSPGPATAGHAAPRAPMSIEDEILNLQRTVLDETDRLEKRHRQLEQELGKPLKRRPPRRVLPLNSCSPSISAFPTCGGAAESAVATQHRSQDAGREGQSGAERPRPPAESAVSASSPCRGSWCELLHRPNGGAAAIAGGRIANALIAPGWSCRACRRQPAFLNGRLHD